MGDQETRAALNRDRQHHGVSQRESRTETQCFAEPFPAPAWRAHKRWSVRLDSRPLLTPAVTLNRGLATAGR